MKKLLKPSFTYRGGVYWGHIVGVCEVGTGAYITLQEDLYNFFLINLYNNLHHFRVDKIRKEIEKNR